MPLSISTGKSPCLKMDWKNSTTRGKSRKNCSKSIKRANERITSTTPSRSRRVRGNERETATSRRSRGLYVYSISFCIRFSSLHFCNNTLAAVSPRFTLLLGLSSDRDTLLQFVQSSDFDNQFSGRFSTHYRKKSSAWLVKKRKERRTNVNLRLSNSLGRERITLLVPSRELQISIRDESEELLGIVFVLCGGMNRLIEYGSSDFEILRSES